MMKCVLVRLHISPVGPNTTPDKIAQQILWVLQGAVVPGGLPVRSIEAWDCPNGEDQRPDLEFDTYQASKLREASERPPRPFSATSEP